MAPLVKKLPSYIKDTKHALQIFENISFQGQHRFIFTMDVKSLYTVIPHQDGLEALRFFFNQKTNQKPSTTTLVHLAELVLTLNFSFDGEHYWQISGFAMGTKMGPNYANLFVGYVEKQIFECYTGPLRDSMVGSSMTALALHHVCTLNWIASLTLLIISIETSRIEYFYLFQIVAGENPSLGVVVYTLVVIT